VTVALLVAVAALVYAQLSGDEDGWHALRGPYPFGEGKCAVALSPDRTVERTVCIAGGTTSCFDGRRRLAMARADCQRARDALTEDGLLP
jgi:hypothetical protein